MAPSKRNTRSSPSSPSAASATSPNSTIRTLPAHQPSSAHQPLLQPKRIHKPPKPLPLLKRWWLFYEGSFAGSMLETWEKILLHTVLLALMLLFYIACSRYLPARASLAWKRVQWYLFGGENGAPLRTERVKLA